MMLGCVVGLVAVSLAATPSTALLTGAAAFGDWRADAPGVQRHIKATDLPAPKIETEAETPDVRNMPKLIARPPGALPRVPVGFTASVYATGLNQPRVLRRAPNGDIFVVESGGDSKIGRILVFRAPATPGAALRQEVFAENLKQPYGLAFYPAGPTPRFLYVGEAHQVVRFPYARGDVKASGPAQVIVPNIPSNRHWTRDLAAAPDGSRLFVAVGSGSNVAGGMPPRTPDQIRAWEATHGRGASWGEEENRGVVRVFDPEGRQVRNFATGLRNCSSLAVQPVTGAVWCAVNERDHLGDNVPPDYVTRVQDGAFYGWPWYYIGGNEDPRLKDVRPDLRGAITVPDVLIQAHSATLGMVFYDGTQFPVEYRGSAFVALHGSWNRGVRTGYKIVRVPVRDGRATGVYEDFLTGFVADNDHVWGRPVGVVVASDGSLLVTEDGNNTIWRITYRR
jgi:glucose/arabinose dehydrogenase